MNGLIVYVIIGLFVTTYIWSKTKKDIVHFDDYKFLFFLFGMIGWPIMLYEFWKN